MPKPSRRLLMFCAGFLIVIAAPVAVFVSVAVRDVFTPPVAGTRFFSYDGLVVDGSCANQPSWRGGQVLLCNVSFHIDSRFAVVDHDAGAVAWCVQRVDNAHYNAQVPKQFGPVLVTNWLSVPPDWGNCSEMVPRQAGVYVVLVLKH